MADSPHDTVTLILDPYGGATQWWAEMARHKPADPEVATVSEFLGSDKSANCIHMERWLAEAVLEDWSRVPGWDGGEVRPAWIEEPV